MSNQHNVSDKCTFELLSAYLDGEVTSSERQQVQEWLVSDPEVQKLYQRLQNLRDGFQHLPVCGCEYSAQDLSNNVFAKIDQQRKIRKTWLWGGGAIAAMLVTAMSNIFSESNTPILQFAQQQQDESLMIAFNRPPIDIPQQNQAVQTEALMIPIDRSLIEMSK
jgi:anti-sigma factor RsiW